MDRINGVDLLALKGFVELADLLLELCDAVVLDGRAEVDVVVEWWLDGHTLPLHIHLVAATAVLIHTTLKHSDVRRRWCGGTRRRRRRAH